MAGSTFAGELRACLGEMLRSRAPEVPADVEDPLRFFTQWLAESNLGLVPIADPGSFDWAGQWLGVLGSPEDRHAVVMFGSPSGVWLDPAGLYRDQTQIVAGWTLSPLDLHLPTETPYGGSAGAGTVAAILVAPDATELPRRVDAVAALPGKGLEGDRYAKGVGTFNAPGHGYQLTLIEGEVLDEIGLPWEEARRNIVTTGISLNALVGKRFKVGSVECIGRRLAEPCSHLEKIARPGLLRPLVHRGGLRADILTDGTITTGDTINP